MEKINIKNFYFLPILSICILIVAFSIFYYLVIFLPNYKYKNLELYQTTCKNKTSINNIWVNNEYKKDLNEDGKDEWLIIDGPHGSGGFGSFDLYSMIDSQPKKVFSSKVFYQGVIKIVNNKIVVSYGFPREKDANCCPSRSKIATYIFKNDKIILESEKTVENKVN